MTGRRGGYISIIMLLAIAALGADFHPATGGSSGRSPAPARAAPPGEQGPSIEDLGNGVINALRQDSFEALTPFVPDRDDFEEIFRKLVELGEATEERVAQEAQMLPQVLEMVHGSLQEDFENVRRSAARDGVRWDQVEISGYRVFVPDPETGSRRELDAAAADVERPARAEIRVRLSAADQVHELNLGDCFLTSHGWIILERFSWARPEAEHASRDAAIAGVPAGEPGAVAMGAEASRNGPSVELAPIETLADLLVRDLDGAFRVGLEATQIRARAWQADARLYEIRLIINGSGELGWRFHWVSDESRSYLQLFSSEASMRVSGEDAEAASRPTPAPEKLVGFDRALRTMYESGVELQRLTPDQVIGFELSYQDWRDPAGYYYYLFLTNGAQHWIVAESGEMQ